LLWFLFVHLFWRLLDIQTIIWWLRHLSKELNGFRNVNRAERVLWIIIHLLNVFVLGYAFCEYFSRFFYFSCGEDAGWTIYTRRESVATVKRGLEVDVSRFAQASWQMQTEKSCPCWGRVWFCSLTISITIIIIVVIIVINNKFDLGDTVALLLQDHCTMLPSSVNRLFPNVHNSITWRKCLWKQESFKFPPERDDGWSRLDSRRQRVPSPSCSHRKSMITDRCVTCRWNHQSVMTIVDLYGAE